MADILDSLEFNGLHSEHDKLTKALFLLAAEEIRRTRHEIRHTRRLLRIEEAATLVVRADAWRLEEQCTALLAANTELGRLVATPPSGDAA